MMLSVVTLILIYKDTKSWIVAAQIYTEYLLMLKLHSANNVTDTLNCVKISDAVHYNQLSM